MTYNPAEQDFLIYYCNSFRISILSPLFYLDLVALLRTVTATPPLVMEIVHIDIITIVITVESGAMFVSSNTLVSVQPNTALWDITRVFIKLLTLLVELVWVSLIFHTK